MEVEDENDIATIAVESQNKEIHATNMKLEESKLLLQLQMKYYSSLVLQ